VRLSFTTERSVIMSSLLTTGSCGALGGVLPPVGVTTGAIGVGVTIGAAAVLVGTGTGLGLLCLHDATTRAKTAATTMANARMI
jgi:hypothetical protein